MSSVDKGLNAIKIFERKVEHTSYNTQWNTIGIGENIRGRGSDLRAVYVGNYARKSVLVINNTDVNFSVEVRGVFRERETDIQGNRNILATNTIPAGESFTFQASEYLGLTDPFPYMYVMCTGDEPTSGEVIVEIWGSVI